MNKKETAKTGKPVKKRKLVKKLIIQYGQPAFNTASIVLIVILFFVFVMSQKKIGFIDNALVLSMSDIAKNAQASLDEKAAVYKAEAAKKQQEIAILKELLEKNNDKAAIEKQLAERTAVYESYTKQANDALSKLEADTLKPVYDQINKLIEEYGKKHGYAYIFGATTAGSIVYGNKAGNISDKVVEYINREGKKRGF